MELKLIDKNGKAAKKGVTVSEATFAREFNEALVHQVVVAYMQLATQQLSKVDQLGKVRKDVARVKTVLAEKAKQA